MWEEVVVAAPGGTGGGERLGSRPGRLELAADVTMRGGAEGPTNLHRYFRIDFQACVAASELANKPAYNFPGPRAALRAALRGQSCGAPPLRPFRISPLADGWISRRNETPFW
jgi:hypothetical protein